MKRRIVVVICVVALILSGTISITECLYVVINDFIVFYKMGFYLCPFLRDWPVLIMNTANIIPMMAFGMTSILQVYKGKYYQIMKKAFIAHICAMIVTGIAKYYMYHAYGLGYDHYMAVICLASILVLDSIMKRCSAKKNGGLSDKWPYKSLLQCKCG